MEHPDRRRSSPRLGPDDDTAPARRRMASDLVRGMAALDAGGDHPLVNSARERLRARATGMGLRMVSLTLTHEPIPDPAIEVLPRADFQRVAAISREMSTRPGEHVRELEGLVARYPHIPMLRNHLAGALAASGRHEEADRLIAETVRAFPNYVFALCNHVMALLSEGRIDEARTLVESGPRGPRMVLCDVDPSRDTFHVSEAISHAAMVGHYLLATGRRDAARVQLEALKELAPKSPQTKSLVSAFDDHDTKHALIAALLKLKAQSELRAQRRAKKSARATGKNTRPKVKGVNKSSNGDRHAIAPPAPSDDQGLFDR